MKLLQYLILTSFLFILSSSFYTANGQITLTSEGKEKNKEVKSFSERIWYGGGFALNFGGGNGSSAFLLGISPMAGYKINEMISIGPRISLEYYEIFVTGQNPKALFWGAGPFVRAKVFDSFFGQVEYEIKGLSRLNDRANGFQDLEDNQSVYIGVGYQSGGGNAAFGYEMMALYDLTTGDSSNSPISFRLGVNWNF